MKAQLELLFLCFICEEVICCRTHHPMGMFACSTLNHAPLAEQNNQCNNLARSGSCSFYDCYKERFPCHNCDNARKLAKCKCRRLRRAVDQKMFNNQGQLWLNATIHCMINKAFMLYTQETINCLDSTLQITESIYSCAFNNTQMSVCDIYAQNISSLRQLYLRGTFFERLRGMHELENLSSACRLPFTENRPRLRNMLIHR